MNRSITSNGGFPITDLHHLREMMSSQEDLKFPDFYVPEFVSDFSIRSRVMDATAGMHQEIVFLVATPKGNIINDSRNDICQIPRENGWIGRYLIGASDRDQHGRSIGGRFLCTYWINPSEILLRTTSFNGSEFYEFVSRERNELPEDLVGLISSPTFFEDYLEKK